MRILISLCGLASAGLVAAAWAAPEPRPATTHATAPVADAAIASTPSEAVAAPASRAATARASLAERLRALAPDLDRGVLALAVEARNCAVRNGEVGDDSRLAVIDYSTPSTKPRLWVFDVANDRLLFREHVAHGQGSGENVPTRFSNQANSHATSLGLFRTAETYIGGNGYSMRMDGLDPGFNDNARARAIVMHGADYVNPQVADARGRLGRSYGCPALRRQFAKVVIDSLKQRQLVFAYANDAAWLRSSHSFACDGRSARQILAAARGNDVRGGSSTRAVAAS